MGLLYARTIADKARGRQTRKRTQLGHGWEADGPDYLSGITIVRSAVSTTNTASSFAGAVVLAFWLTW